MKRMILCGCIALGLGVSTNVYGQKNGNDKIMNSTNVKEIETFLASAHPDDPRRNLLRKKLVRIKNETWSKGHLATAPTKVSTPKTVANLVPVNPMKASFAVEKTAEISIPNGVKPEKEITVLIKNPEEAEFERLMSLTPKEHQAKTVQLLNSMFDSDKKNSKEAIILVENNSDCNLVMRINGPEKYSLAVPGRAKNFVVVKKANYTIQSSVCNVPYTSTKNLNKSIIIALNHRTQPTTTTVNTLSKPNGKGASN